MFTDFDGLTERQSLDKLFKLIIHNETFKIAMFVEYFVYV